MAQALSLSSKFGKLLNVQTTWAFTEKDDNIRNNIVKTLSRKFASDGQKNDDDSMMIVCRGRKQWVRPYLSSLYKRRVAEGPEPERPRSVWSNWNYESELYSFGKRLQEEFNKKTLRRAFTNRSYVDSEMKKRESVGLPTSEEDFQLEDNEEMIELGDALTKEYVTKFLKQNYPYLPDEGIKSIEDYLTSNEMLAYIASNLGVKDLILTSEFPPSTETLSRSFKAIIAALHADQGEERTEKFIKDFILTQLVGKRVEDFWVVKNPMGLLCDILKMMDKSPPELRLLWSSGSGTIMSSYVVGIYCEKILIGQAPGETVSIAEEMAAQDALRTYYDIRENRTPLPFDDRTQQLRLNSNSSNQQLQGSS